MSTQMAGEIRSNLKPVTTTYDEEMRLAPADEALYNSLPRGDDSAKLDQTWEAGDQAFELNYAAAASQRWEGQHRWMGQENEAMRFVRIMHPHDIFRRLRHAGVDARTEAASFYVNDLDHKTGKPITLRRERSTGRLWLSDYAVRGRVGVCAWMPNPRTGRRERQMVTTLQYPYGPEWSLLYFNEYDVPITERYRGWRTAMLRLIVNDVLTEAEVDKAFGPVLLNSASLIYRRELQTHRTKRAGITI